jgi:hypothetical protein
VECLAFFGVSDLLAPLGGGLDDLHNQPELLDSTETENAMAAKTATHATESGAIFLVDVLRLVLFVRPVLR